MTIKPVKIVSGFLTLVGVAFLITQQTQLLECASESLKDVRYILVVKGLGFKRGDIISIKNHKVAYATETNFAKRVLGLPGDRVLQNNAETRIIIRNASKRKLEAIKLPLLTHTKEGKLLTPLGAPVIPEGYVFVGGDHPRSFDSRYEEFGLVPFAKIWGKGVLAW